MPGIFKGVRKAAEAIIENPLPTLVQVSLMAMGVPPVWAGAASGAVGAAQSGGNIFKGALTGGALAYVGQKTSTYLSGQGYNPIVVGAGTGAVLGATGSALNGGQSMGLNVLTGGIIGAATGYYVSRKGAVTTSYEDGSTITKYPDGTSTATPANTVDAPVSDLNPPPAGISDAGTAMQAVISDTSSYAIANTGMVNFDSANLLAEAGYTPTQVESLIYSGYNVDQLVDMATIGVEASTLQSLSTSPFSEYTINDLLSNNVSANEIANASNLVNSGQVDMSTANTLLKSGVDTNTFNAIANSGQASQASYLMSKGVSADSVKYMLDNNVNLNDANWKLETKQLSTNQINSNVESAFPTKPIEPVQQPSQVAQQPTQPVVPESTLFYSEMPDYAMKATYQGQEVYYDPVNGYVYNSDGTLNQAASKFAEQGSQYVGVKTADAQKVIMNEMFPDQQVVSDAGSGGGFRVDVSGSAGYQGNPSAVIPEYRTQGTDLATQQQIDNGTARFNASANAWEVPTDVYVPNVTVTPPSASQPSNLQVAQVTVNPNQLINPTQPVVNVPNIPIVTTPTVTAPAATQPVTPTTTPTTTPTEEKPVVPLTPLTPLVPGAPLPDRTVTNVIVPEPTVTPPVAPPPETIPYNPPPPPTTPPVVNVPNPPLVTEPPETKPTTYGTYSWGNVVPVKIPRGLNPGLIAPTPYYQTTNPAQSQYYWGSHPYQEGPTFNSQLYNTAPGAPATPYGLGRIQTQATPEQILAAMQGLYPNLGTQTVTGPAVPIQ